MLGRCTLPWSATRHQPASSWRCQQPLCLQASLSCPPQLASLTKFCVTATHSSKFSTMCHQLRCSGGRGTAGASQRVCCRAHRTCCCREGSAGCRGGTPCQRPSRCVLSALHGFRPACHSCSPPPHRHKHDLSLIQDALCRCVAHRLLREGAQQGEQAAPVSFPPRASLLRGPACRRHQARPGSSQAAPALPCAHSTVNQE